MYIMDLEPATALSHTTPTPADTPPLQNQCHLSTFVSHLFCFGDPMSLIRVADMSIGKGLFTGT